MQKRLISVLLATVAMPMVAIAQTSETTPAQTEEPAVQTQEPAPAAESTRTEESAAENGDDADAAARATDDEADDPDQAPARLAGEDAVDGPFVTVPQTGAWRVSDLEGKSVEDANGESIGSIIDVLVNEQGEVIAVLVGVGGFLGLGEKHVAVAMSALQFGPGKTEGLPTAEELRAQQQQAQEQAMNRPATDSTLTSPSTTPTTMKPTTEAPEPATPVVGEDNLPDRIVLNVTREELEAVPAYEDLEGVIGTEAPGTEAPADTE
jgi:sporulation protein YlmC with PRC-barrel domain